MWVFYSEENIASAAKSVDVKNVIVGKQPYFDK